MNEDEENEIYNKLIEKIPIRTPKLCINDNKLLKDPRISHATHDLIHHRNNHNHSQTNHHTLTEVTLAKENQSKNLEKVEVNGTDETNDTSIFVEVEVKLNKSDKETENEMPKNVEVVQIPKGSSSLRLSSNIYCEEGDSPYMASPGIYKKGACTPLRQSYNL